MTDQQNTGEQQSAEDKLHQLGSSICAKLEKVVDIGISEDTYDQKQVRRNMCESGCKDFDDFRRQREPEFASELRKLYEELDQGVRDALRDSGLLGVFTQEQLFVFNRIDSLYQWVRRQTWKTLCSPIKVGGDMNREYRRRLDRYLTGETDEVPK